MKERVYEYSVVEGNSSGQLADLVTHAISMNPDARLHGGLVISPSGLIWAQAIVYVKEET